MSLLFFSLVLRLFMLRDPARSAGSAKFSGKPYFAGSGTCSDTPKPVMLPTTRVE